MKLPRAKETRYLLFTFISVVLLWSSLSAVAWYWAFDQQREHLLASVKLKASTHLDMSDAFRHWASGMGGLYVPEDRVAEFSYMPDHVPDDSAVTLSGKKLVLMSPGRMMKLIMQAGDLRAGVREKLIGYPAHLLNPENAPDSWEKAALEKMVQGASYVDEMSEIDGHPWYRRTHRMDKQKQCLTCHADYASMQGVLVGAISVAVDIAPYEAQWQHMGGLFAYSFGGIWFVGLIGIALFYRNNSRRLLERYSYMETLQRLSYQDALTHVANRRMFDAMFEREWHVAKRERAQFSLLMIDIDHFKQYNDMHGHQAGDVCLMLIANAISGVSRRASDLLARYGGEEFVLLLPNTGREQAVGIAQQCLQAVTRIKILKDGSPYGGYVSISIGVATEEEFDGQPDDVLRRSDQALYRAKGDGRNCIRVASGDEVIAPEE